MFPGKYNSDFAVQVTSGIGDGAQQFAINFTNNNLLGSANFTPTIQDKQSAGLRDGRDDDHGLRLRTSSISALPSHLFANGFHPDEGRGTRKHNFLEQLLTTSSKE
jgi:type I restriction enzyme R subunit